MDNTLPKLYDELAGWWQLISPTEDYADEATFFAQIFADAGAQTILELGAGGGNVAWHLKKQFVLTLTDLSPGMIEESKKQNPELEHSVGDMRDVRLGKTFDGVFIHDAIMNITSEADLAKVFETAAMHLEPGGTLVIAPDCTKETYQDSTNCEGHDDGRRSVRYIEWCADPDPNDTVFNYDFIIGLKSGDELRSVVDRQICGVFPRQTWLNLLDQAGFDAKLVEDTSTAGEVNERLEIFVATKRK